MSKAALGISGSSLFIGNVNAEETKSGGSEDHLFPEVEQLSQSSIFNYFNSIRSRNPVKRGLDLIESEMGPALSYENIVGYQYKYEGRPDNVLLDLRFQDREDSGHMSIATDSDSVVVAVRAKGEMYYTNNVANQEFGKDIVTADEWEKQNQVGVQSRNQVTPASSPCITIPWGDICSLSSIAGYFGSIGAVLLEGADVKVLAKKTTYRLGVASVVIGTTGVTCDLQNFLTECGAPQSQSICLTIDGIPPYGFGVPTLTFETDYVNC
ncbi:hypothetical protein HT576_16415 [Haloterrigena sp. SYSU A121-1]|uniref:Uncharacterized protein n=2 Tax=Haloterrigena gelatinilytica TaxID=2741724 RepID=A0A8J8KH07_9EURY|nr:hypothetical protein [Haloterrigena gelatinilytica]